MKSDKKIHMINFQSEFKIIQVNKTSYAILKNGNIFSFGKNIFLKPDTDKDGYKVVTVGRLRIKVHRLILIAFKRHPKKNMLVRHLDGNPANNNLSNLKWGNPIENWIDRKKHGRINPSKGEKNGSARFTNIQITEIKKSTDSKQDICKKFNISRSYLNRILNNERWRHI